jgi:hypothetical protein
MAQSTVDLSARALRASDLSDDELAAIAVSGIRRKTPKHSRATWLQHETKT